MGFRVNSSCFFNMVILRCLSGIQDYVLSMLLVSGVKGDVRMGLMGGLLGI